MNITIAQEQQIKKPFHMHINRQFYIFRPNIHQIVWIITQIQNDTNLRYNSRTKNQTRNIYKREIFIKQDYKKVRLYKIIDDCVKHNIDYKYKRLIFSNF